MPSDPSDRDPHDPFGTARLRSATLTSWQNSPTRLAEDAAAENDLVSVGYRDRLITELAANAADAAAAAGIDGVLAVWCDGRELHVANTGAPLTAAGVESLSALRVSAKHDPDPHDPGKRGPGRNDPGTRESGTRLVGRFGVGFSATATIAERVEIRSRTGSIAFDRDASAAAVRELGADPDCADPGRADPDRSDPGRADPGRAVPLLRLVWPIDTEPVTRGGTAFDTEVVIVVGDDVDLDALLADIAGQVGDLLLELPALQRITVADSVTTIEWSDINDAAASAFTGRAVADPSSTDDPLGTRAILRTRVMPGTPEVDALEAGPVRQEREWLIARGSHAAWMIEIVDGVVVRRTHDVLRAPTPTDIELSLPARCLADLALTPDRRGLHPDADIAGVAAGYSDLIRLLPPEQRSLLIPAPGLARNPVDAELTAAVLEELATGAWVPTLVDGDIRPGRARVLPVLTDDLAAVLTAVIGDLVPVELSVPQSISRLSRVGVTTIGLSEIAEALIGSQRPAAWWWRLYDALSPVVTGAVEVDELGTLPVPRADGRMNIGARGLFLPDPPDVSVSWLAVPDPAAVHPLLERLGAQRISVFAMIDDPALRSVVDHLADEWENADVDEVQADRLTAEVAGLIAAARDIDPDAGFPEWLSGLLLRDEDGDLVRADELLLPAGPLREVLVDDAPFGIVDADAVARFGTEVLRCIGVGWGFLVVDDDLPTAPDHDLPDEADWWATLDEPPESMRAVRDLDLVDADRWPQALSMLVADERIAPLLLDRRGYTAWWLRRHAEIGGRSVGQYRSPDDERLEGVLDPLPHPHAADLAGALAGEIESVTDALLLLDHLADPARDITAGAAVAASTMVVRACRHGIVSIDDFDTPTRFRTLRGAVTDDAVVVDRPWFLEVIDDDRAVLAGVPVDAEDAAILADLLDLPTASDELVVEVTSEGTAATWTHPEAMRFAALRGAVPERGELRLHDDLRVTVRIADEERTDERTVEKSVRWWVDDRGVTHLTRHGRR